MALAVTDHDDLEEAQPQLLVTTDKSELPVLASHKGGGASGNDDSWHWESLQMVRWEGLWKGRFLVLGILEDGEVGRPRDGKVPGSHRAG